MELGTILYKILLENLLYLLAMNPHEMKITPKHDSIIWDSSHLKACVRWFADALLYELLSSLSTKENSWEEIPRVLTKLNQIEISFLYFFNC